MSRAETLPEERTWQARDLERVADAIARHKGAGPLHLMSNESARRQYLAAASAALEVAANLLGEQMENFPQKGRHVRATWAVSLLRTMAGGAT